MGDVTLPNRLRLHIPIVTEDHRQSAHDVMREAAEHIEALEAKNARLQEALNRELMQATEEAERDLHLQDVKDRVAGYPQKREYTPAMARYDRLRAAQEDKG